MKLICVVLLSSFCLGAFGGIGSNQKIIVGFCPNNVQRYADTWQWGIVRWKEPEFIASPAETRIYKTPSRRPGTYFPVGTTPVTYKAKDGFGNVAWCNFTVTVVRGCPPRVFPKNGTFACLEVKGKLEICATVCEEINGDLRNIEGVTMCGFSGKRFFLKLPQDVPRSTRPCGKISSLATKEGKIKKHYFDYLMKTLTPFCMHQNWYKGHCNMDNVKIITG